MLTNHNELLKLSQKVYLCKLGVNQAKGSKDISILVTFHLIKASCDLKNEVKVTKIKSAHKLVLVTHLCKLEKIHSLFQDISYIKNMTLKIVKDTKNIVNY